MNHTETLAALTAMLPGQSEDIGNILRSAIDRIENVLQVELELADWASGELFARARAESAGQYGVFTVEVVR